MTPAKAEIGSEIGVAVLVKNIVAKGDHRRHKDWKLFNSCRNSGYVHGRENGSRRTVLLRNDHCTVKCGVGFGQLDAADVPEARGTQFCQQDMDKQSCGKRRTHVPAPE